MKKVLTLSLAATLATSSVALAHGGGAKFFERLDGDGDGRITQQEMLSQKLAWFDEADTNKDGALTPEERKAAFESFKKQHPEQACPHGPGHHGRGPRGKADDTRRSEHPKRMQQTWKRSEVAAHVAERFAKADANGDGVLTRDEMRRGHHRGGHGHGRGQRGLAVDGGV